MHAVGYCLDPQFHGRVAELQADPGNNQLTLDELVPNGLFAVMKKILGDDKACAVAKTEWSNYQTKTGAFCSLTQADWDSASEVPAWQWWHIHGTCAGYLQKVAMRVLAQPSSSSACEQNWSTFDFIHNKRRNRLQPQRAADLVYVFTNLRLIVANTSSNVRQPFQSWEFDISKGRSTQLEPADEDSDAADAEVLEEEAALANTSSGSEEGSEEGGLPEDTNTSGGSGGGQIEEDASTAVNKRVSSRKRVPTQKYLEGDVQRQRMA